MKIIAVTSCAIKGERDKTLAAGCDDYIVKFIDIGELPRLIMRCLADAVF